ncbi:hypothetical protein IEQ34_017877 [Dendrobium chrysotoxum]|uniref:Uncharacterized protein n=1 Tax=Dendrobium chrysotoxum TaxID=161865 RepID=A0AAV7GCU8_DENCH|nr:hypothetical protein IEQ34_017877 [Dendrobium chrysotoxum]
MTVGVSDELLMRSGFDYLAGMDIGDRMSVANGGEAMGNNYSSPAYGGGVEGFLNDSLGLGVESTGGFIQEKDLWLSYECSRNGNALLLTARHLNSSLTHLIINHHVNLKACKF